MPVLANAPVKSENALLSLANWRDGRNVIAGWLEGSRRDSRYSRNNNLLGREQGKSILDAVE